MKHILKVQMPTKTENLSKLSEKSGVCPVKIYPETQEKGIFKLLHDISEMERLT